MPLYEFVCQSCGHQFDVLTGWSRKSEVRCPKCEAADLKEKMGACAAPATGGKSSGGSVPASRFS